MNYHMKSRKKLGRGLDLTNDKTLIEKVPVLLIISSQLKRLSIRLESPVNVSSDSLPCILSYAMQFGKGLGLPKATYSTRLIGGI